MVKIIKKVKCFFGFHEWVNISFIPFLKKGSVYCYKDFEECKYCHKENYLGDVVIDNTEGDQKVIRK